MSAALLAECEERTRVITEARRWIGTPHVHGAAVRGAGVDCGRLLIEVYANAGLIPPFDPGLYPHDYHLHQNEERYLAFVERFAHRVDRPEPGDVALFKYGRVISHGAIVIQWPVIIHAYVGQGVTEDHVVENAGLWPRYEGAWSLFPVSR